MRYKFVLIASFLLLFSAVFAQNETANPCAGITCNPSSTTCPDGTAATCINTCSGGTCSTCTPSCAGHETVNRCAGVTCNPTTSTCPDNYVQTCPNTCNSNTGSCSSCVPDCSQHQSVSNATQQTNKCAGVTCEHSKMTCPDGYTQTCPNSCDSNTDTCSKCTPDCSQHQATNVTTPVCPAVQPIACASGEVLRKKLNDKGCVTAYYCEKSQCPAEPPKPVCPAEQSVKPIIENNCIMRYECYTPGQESCENVITYGMDGAGNCKGFSNSCLPPGWKKVDRCPDRGEGKAYCGNNICDIGEDPNNCQSDCEPKAKCAPSTQCADGSTRRCYPVGSGCGCDPCGPPPGCREEKDATGFVRIVCETREAPKPVCPTIPQEVRLKCTDNGGVPTFNKDPAGCEVFDCRFQGQAKETPVSVFRQYQCPTKEDWETTSRKCASLGMRTVTVVEGGCNFPRCVQEERKEECGLVPGPERERIEAECKSRGLGTVSQFDGNGCQRIECGQEFDCPRDMPKQAYMKCEQNGGEMVVKRDNRGCIAFTDCVIRGDDTKVYVEKADKVPESTELLSVAFKLENLKIELDKLAKQTDEIADYYKSTGSGEENRFRRVSDMFEAAKGKVDEIKNKIKDRLKDITVDDMTEIRQDIKYIKDVMIKDIVYVMLSSSEDVQDIINSKPLDVAEKTDVKDCGTDGMCFDRAFRLCKQVSFRPEGRDGPIVKVMGLDGNACVMKVTIPEDQGPPAGMIPGINPPYEMKCRIEKYALGVKNPDTDIIPFCEGNLKELMKYDKQRPEGTREGVGICGDTICDDFEQSNPQDCPQDCGPLLSQPAQRAQPVTPVQQVQTTASTCPVVNELQCPAGKVRVARSGSSGCIIGYDCVSG